MFCLFWANPQFQQSANYLCACPRMCIFNARLWGNMWVWSGTHTVLPLMSFFNSPRLLPSSHSFGLGSSASSPPSLTFLPLPSLREQWGPLGGNRRGVPPVPGRDHNHLTGPRGRCRTRLFHTHIYTKCKHDNATTRGASSWLHLSFKGIVEQHLSCCLTNG